MNEANANALQNASSGAAVIEWVKPRAAGGLMLWVAVAVFVYTESCCACTLICLREKERESSIGGGLVTSRAG